MRKILFILLLSSGSIFANIVKLDETTVEESEIVVLRTKCEIVRDDVYTYCVNHGMSTTQATAISAAALTECKKVSTVSAPQE
jgi:hypothetical protein